MLDVGPGSKYFETFCQNFKSGGTSEWRKSLWLSLLVHCPAQCKSGTSLNPYSHLYVCAGGSTLSFYYILCWLIENNCALFAHTHYTKIDELLIFHLKGIIHRWLTCKIGEDWDEKRQLCWLLKELILKLHLILFNGLLRKAPETIISYELWIVTVFLIMEKEQELERISGKINWLINGI